MNLFIISCFNRYFDSLDFLPYSINGKSFLFFADWSPSKMKSVPYDAVEHNRVYD